MIIRAPHIDEREEQRSLGIRTQTPMKGMFKVVDRLFKDLNGWVSRHEIEPTGPAILRYHVIDMAGIMDIEAAFIVDAAAARLTGPGEPVQPGLLPAGRYASLIYTGSGYSGNKALVEWARASGLRWDRWDDPAGDGFRCRYEAYLTDPRLEHRKTRWHVEVAIKLAD